MGFGRVVGIFRACMRGNSSANLYRERCDLEIIIFKTDSPIHGGSGNACVGLRGIGK